MTSDRYTLSVPDLMPFFDEKHVKLASFLQTGHLEILAGVEDSARVAALMGDKFGRRITYTILCVATIGAALLFYQTNSSYSGWFLFTGFLIGGISASFYGFFPLYFPELFPTQVRATGQGFCFNFGRVLAAIGALQTANLMTHFGGSFAKAGSVLCSIYLLGIVLVWFCPETKGKELS